MKAMKTMMAALMACAGVSAWGTTNYVDRALGVDVVGRGGQGAPFQSIQFAVGQAASGDTILVAPSVYDNGWGVDPDGYTNRVYVSGKTLVIRASGAREDTVIVGAKDSSDPYGNGSGIGPAAIRCARTKLSIGQYVIFEGLTFGAERATRTSMARCRVMRAAFARTARRPMWSDASSVTARVSAAGRCTTER